VSARARVAALTPAAAAVESSTRLLIMNVLRSKIPTLRSVVAVRDLSRR
jgi:hypothetical protein